MENKDLQIRILETSAIGYLRQGKYADAEQALREQYRLLLEIQKERKSRLHKGAPIFNIGLSLLYQGKTDDAIKWIIFALVEDLITAKTKTDIDLWPASRTIRGICGAAWEDLAPIESSVFEEKAKREIISPEEIEADISKSIELVQTNYRTYLSCTWQLDIEANRAFESKDFKKASETYATWLNTFYKYQDQRKTRIHKGHLIFNLGIAEYQQSKFTDAIKHFLEAYIEDSITARRPEHLKETSSLDILLRLGYADIVNKLYSFVTDVKKDGRKTFDPKKILADFSGTAKVEAPKEAVTERVAEAPESTIPERKSVEQLPGKYSNRVFIGGAYREGLLEQTLRKIGDCVKEKGYEPVIAYDYDAPRDNMGNALLNVHDFDILLIHMCRYVIFDLTIAAGEYNELEWSIRFLRKPTWGVCSEEKKDKKDGPSRLVLDLLGEANHPIYYYSSADSLRDYVKSLPFEENEK